MTLETLAPAPVRSTAAPSGDPLAPWRQGVTVAPVSPVAVQHTIHAYYTASPESPDGSQVVFYASITPEAYVGEIHLLDRATGRERVLVSGVEVEDSHRAACQQWVCDGKRIVFHDVRNGRWVVVSADPATGETRV